VYCRDKRLPSVQRRAPSILTISGALRAGVAVAPLQPHIDAGSTDNMLETARTNYCFRGTMTTVRPAGPTAMHGKTRDWKVSSVRTPLYLVEHNPQPAAALTIERVDRSISFIPPHYRGTEGNRAESTTCDWVRGMAGRYGTIRPRRYRCISTAAVSKPACRVLPTISVGGTRV